MIATGHAEFRGAWTTVAERDAALARETAQRKARDEERRQREEARRKATEVEQHRTQRVFGQTVYSGGYTCG